METAPEPQLSSSVAFGDRSLFPSLRARAFLNHAAVSPPSALVLTAIQQYLQDVTAHGPGAWSRWSQQRERLRSKLGRLLGCSAEDVALGTCTSAVLGDVCLMIDWKAGQRVLCFHGEFPALVTPLQRAAEMYVLELVFHTLEGFADSSGDGLSRVEAELKRGLRLVAVSSVQFQTGLRLPVEELAGLCHRYGAELMIDAAQSLGVVPVDVTRQYIDYLAAPTHKWLMGLEGCGVLYVNPASMERSLEEPDG